MLRFILAVHCHQPVGNFPWVLEEAYQSAYRPFLEAVERHPRIPVSFHYSGSLIDWFVREHPEFLKKLKKLVRRGQAEVLGGGYYEPILPLIPPTDAVGQLKKMNETLNRLGCAPQKVKGQKSFQGAWLAERVWEPQLPSIFNQADIHYTIVDDHHLRLAGIKEEDFFGYYLTEDQGASCALFPSSKRMRYLIPFKPVGDVIAAFQELALEPDRVVVLADDGEKFGLWPGTKKWVYEEGWLENFFQALEQNADWLKCTSFSEVLNNCSARGRFYPPGSSYEEMMEWSGGSFRNFLVKYPESDTLHKRMLWVSRQIQKLKDQGKSVRALAEAENYLYKAQGNDPYWHGVFGGLYLKHLRRAAYHNLLTAERLIDSVQKRNAFVEFQELDLDGDGEEELLIRSDTIAAQLDLNQGGRLLEFSHKKIGFNFLDTLTRREEVYHARVRMKQETEVLETPSGGRHQGPSTIHEQAVAVETDLQAYLIYDRTRRASWVDHVYGVEETVSRCAEGTSEELGDFLEAPYEAQIRHTKGSVAARLVRTGTVNVHDEEYPLIIAKNIEIKPKESQISVSCQIRHMGERPVEILFGSEWNVGLKDAHVNRIGQAEGIRRFTVLDPAQHLQMSWAFNKEARLWYYPVETISDSDHGMERTYQGVSLTFLWRLTLPSRSSWTVQGHVGMEAVS